MAKVINTAFPEPLEIASIQRDGCACHAWVRCQAGGTIDGSYGVTSMTSVSGGKIGFSFLYPMASTDYIGIGNINISTAGVAYSPVHQDTTNLSTTRSDFWVTDSGGNLSDPNRWLLAVFGDSQTQ